MSGGSKDARSTTSGETLPDTSGADRGVSVVGPGQVLFEGARGDRHRQNRPRCGFEAVLISIQPDVEQRPADGEVCTAREADDRFTGLRDLDDAQLPANQRVWWVDGGDHEPLAIIASVPSGIQNFADDADQVLDSLVIGEPGPHPVPDPGT